MSKHGQRIEYPGPLTAVLESPPAMTRAHAQDRTHTAIPEEGNAVAKGMTATAEQDAYGAARQGRGPSNARPDTFPSSSCPKRPSGSPLSSSTEIGHGSFRYRAAQLPSSDTNRDVAPNGHGCTGFSAACLRKHVHRCGVYSGTPCSELPRSTRSTYLHTHRPPLSEPPLTTGCVWCVSVLLSKFVQPGQHSWTDGCGVIPATRYA